MDIHKPLKFKPLSEYMYMYILLSTIHDTGMYHLSIILLWITFIYLVAEILTSMNIQTPK